MTISAVTASISPAGRNVTVEDFVRTGPGTLAGNYLRSFWQPVYHAMDIAAGEAKPLRVFGENFTLYRGTAGAVHLVDRFCPHRGMQLSAGIVEADTIRCFYHGWKFAADGRCLEQPAERSRFADRIRLKSYPVREYLGFVFAYLGDGSPPPFPLYPEYEEFEGVIEIDSYLRNCNYFQNIDNALDQSHLGFVHGSGVEALFGPVLGEQLKVEESAWGLAYTFNRADGGVFVSQYGMPNMLHLAALPTDPEIGWQESHFWWVPIDDVSHIQFSLHRVPVPGDAAERIHARRQARRGEIDIPHQEAAEEILAGRLHLRDIDEKRCDMVRLQDDVAQVGQRRIADRGAEHPGAADIGVVVLRRIWRRELLAFAEGRPGKSWARPPDLRPSVTGLGRAASWAPPTPKSDIGAAAVIDVRPFVEIDMQLRAFGALPQ